MHPLRSPVRAALGLLVALLAAVSLARPAGAAPTRPESPADAPPAVASGTEVVESCDDGSPNGTGGYFEDSGCARQIAILEGRGCIVSHDDSPAGAEDTLYASCPDEIIDCGGGVLTEEDAVAAVEWATQSELWDAGQLAQIAEDPCLLADWDSESTPAGPGTFTKNEAKSGPRITCGTVDVPVQVRARAPLTGLFIAGLMHVSWSACTNGTKLFFDRSEAGRKKAPPKPTATFDMQGPKQALFQTTGAYQATDPRAVGIRVPEQAWESEIDATITQNPAVLGMLHLGSTTHTDRFVAQLGIALPTNPIVVTLRSK